MFPDELAAEWPGVESRLQTADILLFHKRTGPITRMIQRQTDSYWNHSALVFYPKGDLLLAGPLIVEATYGGIEIHQMKKYTDHLETYDIGVLRYPGMKDTERQRLVMNFVLNNIDISYDYSRLIGLFFRPLLLLSPAMNEWVLGRLIHRQNFVCSTFVHQAFRDFRKRGTIAPSARTGGPGLDPVPYEEMVAPGHLAFEPHFRWVFNERV